MLFGLRWRFLVSEENDALMGNLILREATEAPTTWPLAARRRKVPVPLLHTLRHQDKHSKCPSRDLPGGKSRYTCFSLMGTFFNGMFSCQLKIQLTLIGTGRMVRCQFLSALSESRFDEREKTYHKKLLVKKSKSGLTPIIFFLHLLQSGAR